MLATHTHYVSFPLSDADMLRALFIRASVQLQPSHMDGAWVYAIARYSADMYSEEITQLVRRTFKDRAHVFPQDPCTVLAAFMRGGGTIVIESTDLSVCALSVRV